MDQVLQISGLTKNYGRLTAVDQLTMEINRGEVYGVLGPNGSGKTTTLGMLLGVIKPSSGSFSWFGDPMETNNRSRIGSLLETPNFYPYLSAYNNLRISCKIKGVSEDNIIQVLQQVNLYDRMHSKFKHFSLGMKQRLAVASTLLGDPEVLVLDEPTNGLDPQGIVEMRELIKRTASTGKTIIMASHIMAEVEKTCSHVAILKQGKLLASGKISDVLSTENTLLVAAEDMDLLKTILRSNANVTSIVDQGGVVELTVTDGFTTAELNKYLFEQGISPTQLSEQKRNLESEFLKLVRN